MVPCDSALAQGMLVMWTLGERMSPKHTHVHVRISISRYTYLRTCVRKFAYMCAFA